MRRVLAIILAGIVGAGIAAAQAAPPTVDQILDKYVQALGGKAAYEKLTSRVSKGTFELPAQGLTGTVEIDSKAPNKSLLLVELAGLGRIQQGFDGVVAWANNPQGGVRELSGQELSVAKRASVFQQAIRLRELYPQMTLQGQEKVGQHNTYVIEADPGDGSLRRMYFDAESGLMLRSVVERDAPEGRAAFDLLLDDYREVDGIKIPFTAHGMTPNAEYVIKLTEVKHNVRVEDAKFAKPSAP